MAANQIASSAPESAPEMHEELIERARVLTPMLAEHAAEAERLRKPADAVIEALEAAEIFKIMVPRCYGGFGLDLDTLFEVVLLLAEGDASMSWVTSFYIEHNWILCQFPEAFQRELFSDRSYVLAPGMIAPSGQAVREGNGYRLNGRWQWSTGVMHSDWVIAGGVVTTEDGSFDARFFAFPQDRVRVEDTWFVDGMEGTGSNDVVVEDLFVPESASLNLMSMNDGTAPGSTIHDAPLYRTPMLPLLAMTAAVPALGQARSAVRTFRERADSRMIMMLGRRQAETVSAQMCLAKAELESRAAELLLRDALAELMRLRSAATVEDRARIRGQIVMAVVQCQRVIESICTASGASAHRRSDPLQRSRRDVNMLRAHAVFDLDPILQTYGAIRLGQDAPTLMV